MKNAGAFIKRYQHTLAYQIANEIKLNDWDNPCPWRSLSTAEAKHLLRLGRHIVKIVRASAAT